MKEIDKDKIMKASEKLKFASEKLKFATDRIDDYTNWLSANDLTIKEMCGVNLYDPRTTTITVGKTLTVGDFVLPKINSETGNFGHSFRIATTPLAEQLVKYGRITEVNIIVPNKVVEVAFSDGDKQKAICNDSDVFSLETAISICLTKHIVGGSSPYNKMVKDGLKVYDRQLKKEQQKQEEKERIEKKRAKRQASRKKRAEEKKQHEIEEKINIQKEAYIRAMKELKQD